MRTRYSRAAWSGFELVFRPWMRRRLDGIHLRGLEGADWLPSLPLLVVSNHVSWWDGFLLREVHRALRPDAPLHVVMAEAELRKNPIFRWLGAVPLGASPLGGRRLLRDLEERVAARPDAVIGFFPQGRIWPSHRRPLGFERGAAWLAERLAPLAVLPVALHLQPLTRSGAAAFVSAARPFLVRDRVDRCRIEREVTALADDLLAHVAHHGEDAVRAWRAA